MTVTWGFEGLRQGLRALAQSLSMPVGRARVATAYARGETAVASAARVPARPLLGALCLLGGLAFGLPQQAEAGDCVADYGSLVDGNIPQEATWPPTNVSIDGDCTIQNFPFDNELYTNFNFYTVPGQTDQRYLVVFDNVVHTGNMSCNATHEHKIWFTNGSSTKIQEGCQNLLVPVEKIDKRNPGAYVALDVPFSYTMRIPVLYDPATGGVIGSSGSVNELAKLVIGDDLDAMEAAYGVDVVYVSHSLEWRDGTPIVEGIDYSFSIGTVDKFGAPAGPEYLLWTFDPAFIVPATEQIYLTLELILPSASPENSIGDSFVNTAEWAFAREVCSDPDLGIGCAFYDPLPGENGVTQPLTIGEPDLVVTKAGPATLGSTLNLGDIGDYSLSVTNVGFSPAYNVIITDQLPNVAGASMCDTDPTASVSVSLGGAPVAASDYTVSWLGDPVCQLEVSLVNGLSIAPGETLVIDYTTQLDTDVVDGATLTNIVAATQWTRDADPSFGALFGCPIAGADGTPGTSDCEDAHSVLAVFSGYFFEKVAYDPVTGLRKTTALPGETVEYRIRVRSIDEGTVYARIEDDMGALNGASAVYAPGSFNFIGINNVVGGPPASPAVNLSDPSGGTNGDPLLIVDNFEIAPDTTREIVFQLTLAADLAEGQLVTNQAQLYLGVNLLADSNDPNVFGPVNVADPQRAPDPTVITINFPPPEPPVKTVAAPIATIGEEIVYQVLVPGIAETRPLYDIQVTDVLDANLELVSATVSGTTGSVTDTSTANNVALNIGTIQAGEQAVVEIRARVRNVIDAQQGLVIDNQASYTYRNLPAGAVYPALDSGIVSVTLFEPFIETVLKTPSTTTPTAGETLRYSVTLGAIGGSNPDVFDVSLFDVLDLGLVYAGNPTVTLTGAGTVGADNTIAAPVISGDGVSTPQQLSWSLAQGNADIDIPAGSTVTIAYDVQVLDTVLASQTLNNAVVAQWTSLDGASAFERTGVDGFGGALNDYETEPVVASVTTPDLVATIAKSRLSDTYGTADVNVRIGDIVDYELRISMPEGALGNLTLTDTLPQGLDYVEIVSINGQTGPTYSAVAPFSHADLSSANVTELGDPQTGPSTVTWDLGIVSNLPNDGANNDFVIVYRARVINNALAQVDSTPLDNSVDLNYDTAAGAAPTQTDTASVTVLQPTLVASKLSSPPNGSVVSAGQVVTYYVTLTNTGPAPAYDVVVQDTIPTGMRTGGVTVTGIALASGPALNFRNYSSWDPATGVVIWDFDSGVANEYAIPPGDGLVITYTVVVDAPIATGLTLTNSAQANLYYSLDDEAVPTLGTAVGEREVYGPTAPASTALYTTAPPTKAVLSPADATPTIGEDIVYRIAVPGQLLGLDLNNVTISDTLDASLSYVGFTQVSGPAVVDGSSGNNLSYTVGSIPAGQQVVLEVTARVRNDAAVQDGDVVANTVDYVFTGAAAPIPSLPATVTVGEPDLGMTKAVSNITAPGQPATGGDTLEYVLTVSNASAETAYDVNVTDLLPSGLTLVGGSVTATINTAAVAGFNPVPTIVAPNTHIWGQGNGDGTLDIPAGGTLLLTYRVTVDAINAASIDNTAWIDWTSLDTPLAPRERTGDGCPTISAPNDYCFGPATATLAVDSQLAASKTVFNVNTAQPGTTASPGDTLRYTIAIENTGTVAVTGVSLLDEIDALNTDALFVPGSLNVTAVPAGATDASDLAGGASLTGLVDVRDISLNPGETVNVVFELTLVPVIDSGTVVYNQGAVSLNGVQQLLTDDPALGGTQDATETLIDAVPSWTVEKVSEDLDDPSALLAGDRLRYTITVRNTGTEDAIDVIFQDAIPANTSYNANTTTLNGAPVSDPSDGVSAIEAGMLINAPVDATPGLMPADPGGVDPAYVATIRFEVTINTNVLDGTEIANQGYIQPTGAGSGAQPPVPSDDPATATLDDPTRDIVGNAPVIRAQKTVAIDPAGDGGVVGQVDVGDTLIYSFVLSNPGPIPATGVELVDNLPNDTTYVPDSLTINGLAGPAGATLPLIAGVPVSSSDLTPPLPGPGAGTLSPGQSAVVTFRVTVNGTATPGTVITNQGTVTSNELPDEPTDADGDPVNGYQPTTIVVGNAQLLSITKQVSVIGGTVALAGGTLEYVVTATNTGTVPAVNVILTDDLAANGPGLSYVAGSASVNGGTAGVSYDGVSVVTGDYATAYGDLAPGATATLRFRATLDAGLVTGTTVTNTGVVTWNAGTQTASADAAVTIGSVPGQGSLAGSAWHDGNYNLALDAGESALSGWSVRFYRDGTQIGSTLTDATGAYSFGGVPANDTTGVQYALEFLAPGAGPNTAKLGYTSSPFTDGLQRIDDVIVSTGSNLQGLNLPIQPNGVVYDAVSRTPVAGTILTLVRADTGAVLASSCFDDPAQQQQVTSTGGYYRFDLNFSDASCLSGGNYLINVAPPGTGFVGTTSLIIPPQSDASTAAFPVPLCLGSAADGDAIPTTADRCEASVSPVAPPTSIAARTAGTNYYLNLALANTAPPGTSQIFNNHIPLDPVLADVVAITKSAGRTNISRGDLVPYTITVNNTFGVTLSDIRLIDAFPPGFKYVEGSSRYDGQPLAPTVNGNQLYWDGLEFAPDSQHRLQLLFIVGAGVTEGEYTNRAQAINQFSLAPVSGEANATVRVVPDPAMDCSDIVGKVFDDRNLNGVQDEGEEGIGGVRLVTARGLLITADAHGRFHLACAAVPNELRGSNFILKLDDRSLPTGYRVTTENPRVQRLTRGMLMKFNFGATLHRAVRLELGDGVFQPGSTEMREHWKPRIGLLFDELRKAPSVLRLTYLADVEDERLVAQRVAAMKELLAREWADAGCCYQLTIETEVFWRRGAPPSRAGVID